MPSGERWSSGRWSLDVRGDELADIRCDGQVVLRGVRLVARDADWRTAWPREVIARPGADRLMIDLVIDDLGIDLLATVTVQAQADSLDIAVEAQVQSISHTNRTGLVLLHPPRVAGEQMLVTHTDGEEESLRFPAAISPHQPVREIASLTWSDGARCVRAEFEGDVFEMEDQRNWSDASYKTYNRSLDEPFPYLLAAGDHIRQRITLTAVSPPAVQHAETVSAPAVLDLTTAGAFPVIAVGASTAPDPGPVQADPVAARRHVELELTDPAWPAALQRAWDGARDLSVLLVSPAPADPAVLEQVMEGVTGVDLRWIAVVDADSHVSEPELVAALRAAVPADVPVVGGSRSHFTEVNREWDRIPRADLDGLVFPLTPLFHTLDTQQLVESIAMQRLIAQHTTSCAAHSPVHIGPITLRPRFDNVATTPPPAPTRSDLAEGYGAQRTGQSDRRQQSAQLTAWTIASAAACAIPGVTSLTYFEEWGPRGIRAADGTDRPVRAALEALTSLEGTRLLSATSPDGWLWAIGGLWPDPADAGGPVKGPGSLARSEDRTGLRYEVLVANVSGTPRSIELQVEGHAHGRLELEAFGWTRVSAQAAGPSTA